MAEDQSPGPAPTPGNAIADIEQDIRGLIRDRGKLEHELSELKKRGEKEVKQVLLDFIDVADVFEATLKNMEGKIASHDSRAGDWLNHFRSVHKLLMRALKTSGVIPIEVQVGEKANPYWHNVVEVVEQPGREDEAIVEVIKKGYLWQGQLLRAAEVKAVKNR